MKVVRFETEWLNRREQVHRLLNELGMGYDESDVEAAVGRRTHLKSDLKSRPPIARAQAEEMDRRFQALLEEMHVDVAAVRFSPRT